MKEINTRKLKRHWGKVYRELNKVCFARSKFAKVVANPCQNCPFDYHPICRLGHFDNLINYIIRKEQNEKH